MILSSLLLHVCLDYQKIKREIQFYRHLCVCVLLGVTLSIDFVSKVAILESVEGLSLVPK